jgi:hypothetical protein
MDTGNQGKSSAKAGFLDFSHCRLVPLRYRLPARFETIPSRPSLLAGLGEHERSLGREGLAEQDAIDAVDEPREIVSPLRKRALTQVLAVEAQEIECDMACLRRAGLCAQGGKVGMPVRAKRDRLAVDQGAVGSQTADRLRDLRQPVGEIRAVAGPKGHSALLLAGEDTVAVVLDFVQAVRASGRPIDEKRLAREDETGRRGAQ